MKAAEWYSRVAKLESGDSYVITNAQLHLGGLYEAGRVGTELEEQQRYLKAEELYIKAREISVDGYVALGKLYDERMHNRQQDAEHNYREAAIGGNSDAQHWMRENVTVLMAR